MATPATRDSTTRGPFRRAFFHWAGSLVLGCGAIAVAWSSRKMSYAAGYHLHPEIAFMYYLAGGWALLLGAFGVFLLGCRRPYARNLLTRLPIICACLLPLSLGGLGKDPGFVGFMTRIRQDIRPEDLARWCRDVAATNGTNYVRRTLTTAEFHRFSNSNVDYKMPVLYIGGSIKMLKWGSDLETWAIVWSNDPQADCVWQNGLGFRSFQK